MWIFFFFSISSMIASARPTRIAYRNRWFHTEKKTQSTAWMELCVCWHTKDQYTILLRVHERRADTQSVANHRHSYSSRFRIRNRYVQTQTVKFTLFFFCCRCCRSFANWTNVCDCEHCRRSQALTGVTKRQAVRECCGHLFRVHIRLWSNAMCVNGTVGNEIGSESESHSNY